MKLLKKRLYKLVNLSWYEQTILLYSFVLLTVIVIGLRLFSLFTMRRLLAKIFQPAIKSSDLKQVEVDRIVWATKTASRYIKGAICLPQALATQVCLAKYGYSTELYIGVAHHGKGRMSAHAWLEKEGKIVIGECEYLARFIPLSIDRLETNSQNNWFLLSTNQRSYSDGFKSNKL